MDRENDGTVRDSLTVLLAREGELEWIIPQVVFIWTSKTARCD